MAASFSGRTPNWATRTDRVIVDTTEIDGFRIRRARRYSQAAEKQIPVYLFGEKEAV